MSILGRFFPTRQITVVIALDPALQALLESLLSDGDAEKAAQLTSDIQKRTSDLRAAISAASTTP